MVNVAKPRKNEFWGEIQNMEDKGAGIPISSEMNNLDYLNEAVQVYEDYWEE